MNSTKRVLRAAKENPDVRGCQYRSELPEISLEPRPPGSGLADWLNDRHDTEPAARVSSLILKIRTLQHLEAAHKRTLWMQPSSDVAVEVPGVGKLPGVKVITSRARWAKRRETFWQTFDYTAFWNEENIRRWEKTDPIAAEIGRLNLEIRQELDKYTFVPRLHVSSLETRVGWLPASRGQERSVHHALGALLWLVERGLLNTLAQCATCGRWFCSQRSRGPSDKRFCDARCQQKYYKSSPEWKARRAEYMRRYRQTSGRGGK